MNIKRVITSITAAVLAAAGRAPQPAATVALKGAEFHISDKPAMVPLGTLVKANGQRIRLYGEEGDRIELEKTP